MTDAEIRELFSIMGRTFDQQTLLLMLARELEDMSSLEIEDAVCSIIEVLEVCMENCN